MYCPRCGTPNADTIKFCRQCGLPMQQVSGMLSTPPPVAPPAPPATPLAKVTEGMSPKQKMVLTILLWVFSPAILKVLGDATGLEFLFRGMTKLAAVTMVPGILFIVFYYKSRMRALREAGYSQWAAPAPPPQAWPQQIPPPMGAPVYSPPAHSQAPPPTNPLHQPRPGSVTEDETRRFQPPS